MENLKSKILLPLLCFIMVSCSNEDCNFDSSTLYIPDVSFEAALINQGIDSDGIINQKVLKTDVKDIQYLNISHLGSSNLIEDLTGIEGFISLKRLHASGNKLSYVDLSNNTKLDTLNLMANDLTSIKGLSRATNLKWINLSHNLFEAFTVENPSVTNVLMSHNELISFHASGAVNLETVYLLTNNLQSIDFSKNTKLAAINVSNNKLSNLVLGTKNDLFYLSVFQNLLDYLDVSHFDKLDYLIAHENPSLSCIKAGVDQNITSLQLSDYQIMVTNLSHPNCK